MSLMCLFPWFDYGNDISDFENLHFLVGQPIFTTFGGLEIGQFCAAKAKGCEGAQSAFINEKIKIFLENFRIGSNLSRDGFMASDLLGAQKLHF